MSQKKRPGPKIPSAAAMRMAAAAVIVLSAIGGVAFLWSSWGPRIVQQPGFRLGTESIVMVPPQPEWIASDIQGEAMRDSRLEEASLLDRDLIERVAQAFRLHAWVAEVEQVAKQHPSRIVVKLRYRRPAAMVEVVKEGRRGLLPIDAEGVLLPPGDFAPNEVRNYLRIVVDNAGPAGPVGTAWGDERVHGAARIAVALETMWKDWKLYRIHCLTSADQIGATDHQYELLTEQGTKFVWGRAPGKEAPGETVASEKIAQLTAYIAGHGNLDSAAGGLDLRDSAAHSRRIQSLPASERRGQ